jgi:hypothetical protein
VAKIGENDKGLGLFGKASQIGTPEWRAAFLSALEQAGFTEKAIEALADSADPRTRSLGAILQNLELPERKEEREPPKPKTKPKPEPERHTPMPPKTTTRPAYVYTGGGCGSGGCGSGG